MAYTQVYHFRWLAPARVKGSLFRHAPLILVEDEPHQSSIKNYRTTNKYILSAFIARLAAFVLIFYTNSPALAANYLCKTVSSDWGWFSDHVAASITYLIVGSPGRTFEVGTGVFFRGKPWGSKEVGSGTVRITAYGAGALHIRQQGSGDPFKVCATSEAIEPITIIKAEF
ncbi:hypothetical protein [Methylobacterium sp. GXS13]|uniref:hypothetical protein n=1 Tax=Methylobacterium sp. GXS13 TaxID=1730094 RepID=UPI00128EF179|nr:hypothetical protein [Methylobacterium sp. GXS13]